MRCRSVCILLHSASLTSLNLANCKNYTFFFKNKIFFISVACIRLSPDVKFRSQRFLAVQTAVQNLFKLYVLKFSIFVDQLL